MTAGRYAIRKQAVSRLDWDDLVHGLAVVSLLGYVSTYTVSFPWNYEIDSWAASETELPLPIGEFNLYARSVIALEVQFWVCIYLVKLSLLLFYRRIFGVSQRFMKAWWAVLAFTAVTFLMNFLAAMWSCETPRQLLVAGEPSLLSPCQDDADLHAEACLSELAHVRMVRILAMWCVSNVASDISSKSFTECLA